MSIFDALPPVKDRVALALRKDLSLRVDRDFSAGRWNGYAYQGGADLCLRHGSFWSGRPAPEPYHHLRGPMGTCFATHWQAQDAAPELTYVMGYCTTGQMHPFVHAWCVAPDGGVVDLTGCEPTETPYVIDYRTRLPYLARESWGYLGVVISHELAYHHADELGLDMPMIDRGPVEENEHPNDPEYSVTHDYPLLKVPYDPDRKVY